MLIHFSTSNEPLFALPKNFRHELFPPTHNHSAASAETSETMAPPTKRRKTSAPTIEEIAFDHTARHDYLTGFHKRKQARVKAAQEAAARREKEDRMRERRRVREALRMSSGVVCVR